MRATLQLFGRPALRTADGTTPLAASPKAVALLALLAEHFERPLSRDWLAESLWPDAPLDEARANLRRHLYVVGKVAGDGCLSVTRTTAQWGDLAAVDVDAILFSKVGPGDPELAASLYTAEFCEGIAEEALEAPRARFRARYEALVRHEAERAERSASPAASARWLQRLLAFDPLDERAVRSLMRVHAERGDRAHAVDLYNGLLHRMRVELGVEPEEATRALYVSLLHGSSRPKTGNVPVLPRSFVGRERELELLAKMLAGHRRATIAGLGGAGKSTLAQRYAHAHAASYEGGTWLVDAADARGENDLWQRVARTLDLSAAADACAATCRRLSGTPALVILDCCEGATEAARAVTERLLQSSAAVVLATSRAALGGEPASSLLTLLPLEVPPPNGMNGESRLRYAAYRLFVERAAAVNANILVSAGDSEAVCEIVRRLGGLPLAIEIVAARASAATLQELLQDVRNARGSKRIYSVVSWAVRHISARGKRALSLTTVFAGTFTAESARAVCGKDAAEGLEELLRFGLLSADSNAEGTRFAVSDTVRAYASSRLAPAEEARRSHAAYFAGLAEAYALHFATPREVEYFHRADADARNFRTAIEWSYANDERLCARLLRALCPYFLFRADLADPDRYASALLERAQQGGRTDAALLLICGTLAKGLVMGERSMTQLTAAREAFRAAGDRDGEIRALHNLSIVQFNHGARDSEALFRELLELQESAGDVFGAAYTSVNLAASYVRHAHYEPALHLQRSALRTFENLGFMRGVGYVNEAMALTLGYLDRHQESVEAARVSVAAFNLIDDGVWRAQALRTLAAQLVNLNRYDEADDAILQALRLLPHVHHAIFERNVCFTLFEVCALTGRYEAAALAFGKAAEIGARARLPQTDQYGAYLRTLAAPVADALGMAAFRMLQGHGARMNYEELSARAERRPGLSSSASA